MVHGTLYGMYLCACVSTYVKLRTIDKERHVKNKNHQARHVELKAEVDKLERYELTTCHAL